MYYIVAPADSTTPRQLRDSVCFRTLVLSQLRNYRASSARHFSRVLNPTYGCTIRDPVKVGPEPLQYARHVRESDYSTPRSHRCVQHC